MYTMTNRRIRQNPHTRALAREVTVSADKLMQPLFAVDGIREKETIPGLTGVFRETPTSLLKQVEADLEHGVKQFLLFGVPSKKSDQAFDFTFTANQIHSIKKQFGKDIFLAVDVCLCSYTHHGHCGVMANPDLMDHLDNGKSVSELARAALAFAQAGVDCVAPSDMMDHRIRAIRETLDEHKLDRTLIMSYAAKFHSGFYGPFRAAADSAPKNVNQNPLQLKDRSTYQIDPATPSDAFRCALRDADEGADILMVKPGLPYLDVLQTLSSEIPLPWAVYEVSGEFAAIELMAEKGLIDGARAHREAWTAFFRAGAELVITYGARSAKEILA
jgi:porphobilinogen synthase